MPLSHSDNRFMSMGSTAVLFPVFTPNMVISQTLTYHSPLLFKFGLVFNIIPNNLWFAVSHRMAAQTTEEHPITWETNLHLQ